MIDIIRNNATQNLASQTSILAAPRNVGSRPWRHPCSKGSSICAVAREEACAAALNRAMDGKQRLVLGLVAARLYRARRAAKRAAKTIRERQHWDIETGILVCESQFVVCYRMRPQTLTLLTAIIHDSSEEPSRIGIPFEVKVASVTRFLAGGFPHDIRRVGGYSLPTFCRILWDILAAIVNSKDTVLVVCFPRSDAEIARTTTAFASRSSYQVMRGCVGCVDGWLCRVKASSMKATGGLGPRPFFSGHYYANGVNVQAVCDSAARFMFASVAAPGGTSDIIAFEQTSLTHRVEELPIGAYILGDNVYQLSEHLLTPYASTQCSSSREDSFNFYLSQLRIRVEMAFGLLVTKWRIFKEPLGVSISCVPVVVLAAMMLHNYCANNRILVDESDEVSAADIEPITLDSVLGYIVEERRALELGQTVCCEK